MYINAFRAGGGIHFYLASFHIMDKNRVVCGHIIEKIATLALFLLSVAVLAGFVPMRVGFLRGAVEGALRDMGADSVSVGSVSVALWMGARLSEVAAYKRISDGDGYRISVVRADVGCNLVRAAVAIFVNHGVGKTERDVFREVYERPFELAGDVFNAAASLRPVKRVALHGVGVGFVGKGVSGISASGADVVLVRDGGRAFSGSAAVREVVVPALARVENFSAKISVDDNNIKFTGGEGSVFGGKLRVNLAVDARQARILSGDAFIGGLDLEKFCAGTGFSPGAVAGRADIDASVERSHGCLDSMRAKGRVRVTDLVAVDLALQRSPIVSQLSRDLRSLRFSEVKGGFDLVEGKLRFKEIVGVGDVLKFRSAGWVGLDGKISQDFEGELSGVFVAGLSKLARNALEKTDGGGGKFKCKISGPFHNPRIEVDRSVYGRAIVGVLGEMFK